MLSAVHSLYMIFYRELAIKKYVQAACNAFYDNMCSVSITYIYLYILLGSYIQL